MGYSTIADVQQAAGGSKRLRDLSDFESRGAADHAIIEAAIAKADAVINTAVHKRFGVDLSPPIPPAIVALSAEEAVFSMKVDRGMATELDVAMHKERLERIEDFACGESTLGVSPIPGKSEMVVDKSIARSTEKAVARDSMKGFW